MKPRARKGKRLSSSEWNQLDTCFGAAESTDTFYILAAWGHLNKHDGEKIPVSYLKLLSNYSRKMHELAARDNRQPHWTL